MSNRCRVSGFVLGTWALVVAVAGAARAGVYELSAAGIVTENTSGDATLPVGTPWAFELRYDTAAPDRDFELLGSADPTFGRFTNGAVPPALVSFHYQAGSYQATLDDPSDFGEFSEIVITYTSIHAIDVNIRAWDLFPELGGGPVSFHADFNAFDLAPVLANDGLPTDTALGPGSFDESTVTLLPPAGFISGTTITHFAIREVPEPGAGVLLVVGMGMVLGTRRM